MRMDSEGTSENDFPNSPKTVQSPALKNRRTHISPKFCGKQVKYDLLVLYFGCTTENRQLIFYFFFFLSVFSITAKTFQHNR